MNIAMFGHKRMPSREGGVEIVTEELSVRMAALGHRVTCYNRGGHHVSGAEHDIRRADSYKGVRLKTVPTLDKKGLAAASSGFFAALCCGFGSYDAVHIHAEGPAFFCWIPKLFGKKIVVSVHGLDWQREKWRNGFGSAFIHAGEKMAVKLADEMIVLSRNMQDYFKSTYGRDTRYIPNGVTVPGFAAADQIRERFGLEKDSFLLFLGRLVPEKGIHHLIKAFLQTKTDKKLVIAGGLSDSRDYASVLKQLAADSPRILFTGFVQGRLLEELYSNAYVYVLPSDVEGMPLSLLEAMSCGSCCLVSDIPECTELTEDKAAVFKKGDVDSLRENLQRLCDDPAAVAAYKRNAAEFICGRYSWDEATRKTLELYP